MIHYKGTSGLSNYRFGYSKNKTLRAQLQKKGVEELSLSAEDSTRALASVSQKDKS